MVFESEATAFDSHRLSPHAGTLADTDVRQEPRRGSISKPRVARRGRTLGKRLPIIIDPERVGPDELNPFRVRFTWGLITQGFAARRRSPWAGISRSFGAKPIQSHDS
jgi:hypothetical protein